MTALSQSHIALPGNTQEAAARFAEYERLQTEFMQAVGADLEDANWGLFRVYHPLRSWWTRLRGGTPPFATQPPVELDSHASTADSP